MKIKLWTKQVVPGCAWESEITWYLEISTKKEHFWLISYHIWSIIIGFVFSSILIFFIATSFKETIDCASKLWCEQWKVSIFLFIIWLIVSAFELQTYADEYEFSEGHWKKWGKLEMAVRSAVRIVRGLPIIIFVISIVTGIIYGLICLFGLLANLL